MAIPGNLASWPRCVRGWEWPLQLVSYVHFRPRWIVDIPKTRNKGKIEVEDILEPLNGSSRLVCEDLDQFGTGLVPCGFEGVFVEGLDAVLNIEVGLSAGEGAVDTGGSLGRVTTKES